MTTAPPLPSPIAGRYRPRALLGSGGMATVWEAVDDRLGRPVAVKVVATTDPSAIERCRAEARVLATLRHPNVVTVLDAGEHDGRPFVVTELVRGRSLRDRLAEGPMAPPEVARLGRQLGAALGCAHRHGIVHRDLTPANVLLADGSGDAKVIDFGIAVSDHAVGLTATGLVIGTPAYLAPEQVEGRRAGPAVDVYALGLVLVEALTGERPFPGGPTETAAARLVGDAPVPEDLPPGWTPLLAAMTRRDPAGRPDAEAVEHRMAAIEQPGRPASRWSPGAAPTAATATTVGVGPTDASSTTAALARTRALPRTRAIPPTTAVAAGAAAATAPAATRPLTEVRPQPLAPDRGRRRATWPLVLAGTALVLALLLVVGFGALQGGTDGPDVATTPSSAATEPTVDTTVAATTVTVAATAPPTTAGAAPVAPAGSGGPGPAHGKGQDGGKGKGKG